MVSIDNHFDTDFPSDEIQKAAKSEGVAEADADEGWVQSLITRILANISLTINGISLKYVENQLEAALQMESLQFVSTGDDWNPQFSVRE